MDVVTGYFEIGALVALDGQWQKLEKLRILMGNEVTKRTRDPLVSGVQAALDKSIESEKEDNDFLHGVPAIVEALIDESAYKGYENPLLPAYQGAVLGPRRGQQTSTSGRPDRPGQPL
jgi:hypothetical protein